MKLESELKDDKTWVLEYTPEYRQIHINRLCDMEKIDEDWVIFSFHKTMDDALEASNHLEAYQKKNPAPLLDQKTIKELNVRQLTKYLNEKAKTLAEALATNPCQQALDELMGITKTKHNISRTKKPHLRLVEQ